MVLSAEMQTYILLFDSRHTNELQLDLSSMCFLLQDGEEEGKEEFAIVFAAMGVNMETAHYFKQVLLCLSAFVILFFQQRR